MNFHFQKTWGSEPQENGKWRFQFWAPAFDAIELVLGNRHLAMTPANDGWFSIEAECEPGTAYGYRAGDLTVPDPAAREQAGNVHGLSLAVDPRQYEWQTRWHGRPLEELIIYELHTGTFSDEGTFDAIRSKLDHLERTGVTAIELCPVAQFSGIRGWGYDGVLLYAPHTGYGGSRGLKRLVDAAHERGLMVLLDVVYNHFGPDGNYLPHYAPQFFHRDRHTPWGAGIAYDREPVRQFLIENALYWLVEFQFDGLRFDAIDQIHDLSRLHILDEIAKTIRTRLPDRHIHLTTEDDSNLTRLHERDSQGRPMLFSAEWNDDYHHVAHLLATGESDGYYKDYEADPVQDLGVALSQGFVQQGRHSPYRGASRGEPSLHLPPTAFVNFLQNHDQIGNRAFGERLTQLACPQALEAMTAITLLAPTIPLVFMGEEWAETNPFQFFCDFHGELGDAVRKGRRREFARWKQFADEEMREKIPDPNDPATFRRSQLDWQGMESEEGVRRYELFRELLAIRRREIVPRLFSMNSIDGQFHRTGRRSLKISWKMGDGSTLILTANVGATADLVEEVQGRRIYDYARLEVDAWAARFDLAEG